MYYPEDDCPFYRCTVFSHYAAKNVPHSSQLLPTLRYADATLSSSNSDTTNTSTTPKEGPYWSLMFEVSENKEYKPVNLDTIIEETIQGIFNT